MNILLINHYAGSDHLGMEYRPFYFAREWIKAGHRVTIVGASYSHIRANQPIITHDLSLNVEEEVRFRWLRTPHYSGNGFRRVLNMLAFVARLTYQAGRIGREEAPDIVICSSTYPLDIYPGYLIARRRKARLVFEVHDLWPLTPMLLGGYRKGHPYIRLLQHAERSAYAWSDVVISLLPHAKDHMIETGMAPEKFVHIPNGVPVTHLERAPVPQELSELECLLRTERTKGRFLVGYAGGLTGSMDLDLLLDVAGLNKSGVVVFFIAGDGSSADALRARVAAEKLENVHLVGRLPKANIPGFLSAMDTLAVPWCSSPLYQHGVSPNKIFDYMFAARPIVQASDASNDLVAQACCGITVRPADPWAFLQAIEAIRAMPLEDRTRLGTNGRGFVCRHHDIRMLAEQFLLTVAAPKSGRVKFRDGGREETSMEPSAEAVGDLEYLTDIKGLRRSV